MAEKIVGVIGGMGPRATLEFMDRLLKATPAKDDGDHLRLLVDNNPKVPSRIAALIEKNGEDPANALCAMAQGLERQGADFLVMTCNTAHYYRPQIASSVSIPILDMVALAIVKLQAHILKPRRVGVLASPAIRLVGIYEAALDQAGFDSLFPDAGGEEVLLGIIRNVKAGKAGRDDQKRFAEVAQSLVDRGAEALLIACTELSVLALASRFSPMTTDALDALVEATIKHARPDDPVGTDPCKSAQATDNS